MHGKTVKWSKTIFSVYFLISCCSNFPSKSSVQRLKTCKILVPKTLLHTRMIKELICVGMEPKEKKRKKKVVICSQTSSIWNGILNLYFQDIKETIVNLYFFPNSVSKSWVPAFHGNLHFLQYCVRSSSTRRLSTQRGKAPPPGILL